MLLTLGLLAAAFGAAWAFCRFTGKTLGFRAFNVRFEVYRV
jgi:hypothetical protein